MESKKAIIFLHIPKTGGRSLQSILLRHYSGEESITNAHEQFAEIDQWPDYKKRKIKYLQGHFVYGVHRSFPQKFEYIAMMRDPVDRVISHYYYIKRSTSHALNKVIREQEVDLEAYIAGEISEEVVNDQARLIAGVSRSESVSDEEMLVRAKENIDRHFLLVGTVERFDEVLVALKRLLGLKNIFYGIRNKTMNRPLKEQVPSHVLEMIEKKNSVDIKLYDYVVYKFERAISEAGTDFQAEVNKFRRYNGPYNRAFYLVRSVKNMVFGGR